MRATLAGKRIATYARYSSDNQRDASIEDQQREINRFIEQNGGNPAEAAHFVDRAVSASSMQRDGMEALLALVRAGKVDAIVTENTDRISRDLADSALLFRELRHLEVPLIGVSNRFDSSTEHAQLQLMMEAWKNEQYLKDLSFKTRRGLVGRALAGLSTGGRLFGYRTQPVVGPTGETVGYRIEVDEEQAGVVRRVFALYIEGHSLDGIAKLLNEEGVAPPRAASRNRRAGWVASTIRAFLHNDTYTGRRTYNRREWRKVPGTNKRRWRHRDPSAVMQIEDARLRVIDEATWSAVQQRLAAVHARYTRAADGQPKGRGIVGGSTRYLLSGLLVCGACGAPMVICGGSTTKYYWCGDYRKRGPTVCGNALSLREDIARTRVLDALRDRFSSPGAIDYLRRRIAAHLGSIGRTASAELGERRDRLARTQARLRRLIDLVADGNDGEEVRLFIKDIEAQARVERAAIAALEHAASAPVRLPTPDDVLARALDLDAVLASDTTRGREALRRLFEGGKLKVTPQPDGTYMAQSKLLPLMLFAPEPQNAAPPAGGRGRSFTALGCAGRI